MGKGRSFKAPEEMVDRSEPSPRATRRLAAFITASLAVGLLALSGCSPNVVFESAGAGAAYAAGRGHVRS